MYQPEISPFLKYSRYILCIGFIIAFTAYLVPAYAIYVIIAGTGVFLFGFIGQLYLSRSMRKYKIKTSLGIDFLFPEIDSWLVAVDFIAMPKEPIPTEADLTDEEINDMIIVIKSKKRKRNQVANQLASGGQKVLPAVTELLTSEDPDLRAKAAAIIRHLGSRAKEAIPTLINYIGDEEPVVQGQVICALARIGPPALDASQKIANQLQHENADIRICSALALGRIHKKKKPDDDTLNALTKLLNDPQLSVQNAALIALGDIGEKVDDEIELLISGLRDLNPILALQCTQYLGRIGKKAKDSVPDLIEALGSNHPIIQIIVSHALYRIGYDPLALLRPVLTAAKSGEIYVKMDALHILEEMGPMAEPAMQAYVRMLGDKNTLVRVVAVRGISYLGEKGRPLAPQLRRALADPAKAVRYHAKATLEGLGEPLEEPKLIEDYESDTPLEKDKAE